ncbi:MAG: TIGR00282 family metallophosphoesterase [Desulfobacterota bacterium]|nr:TIGR00282 family metallophosphoesterase [Thermodesulfobacteriota bacterium]MDW8001060.1 TIGR00282 family metallophosphoesterase [Deltaproteobacteria bacterium]
MQDSLIEVIFLGDVVGKPGRLAVKEFIKKAEADFIVINGENLAGGLGITPKVAEEMFSCGVDVITTGNHVWKKKEVMAYLGTEKRLLRPLNYPPEAPGYGFTVVKKGDKKICVVNIEGRIFMNPLPCPFRAMEEFLKREGIEEPVIVDFHAEATSEKIAMGWFLDGKVSAVIGTHTHVQTSDERILPKGTGYITDAGMTGPQDSVIGMEKDIIIERFLTQIPQKFCVGKDNVEIQGVKLKIDKETRKCVTIERLKIKVEL